MVLPPAVVLEVVVLPEVTEGHVSNQQHGHASDTSLLHVDVLVVISVMAIADAGEESVRSEVPLAHPGAQFTQLHLHQPLLTHRDWLNT